MTCTKHLQKHSKKTRGKSGSFRKNSKTPSTKRMEKVCQPGGIVLILAEPSKKRRTAQESGRTNMSIAKIETASGVTLVLNGKTVFASDDTSYWMQGSKVIGDDGHVYGHAETIRDALCLVLARYGGLKGNSTKQTKPIKAVRAW